MQNMGKDNEIGLANNTIATWYPCLEKTLGKRLSSLRERLVKLEVKIGELAKRMDNLSNYTKELYNYPQKQASKPTF